MPLVSKIVLEDKSWQAVFQATFTNRSETLAVLHSVGSPNEYRFGRGEGTNGATILPAPLPRAQIWETFAGSDFSVADLGLEFFHWPTQTLVLNEMRKNRACHVLESRPSVTNDYARVLAWVDVETGGVVMAEAYDVQNRRVKEFEILSVKQGRVQEMKMSNVKNRSRTILVFEVPGD